MSGSFVLCLFWIKPCFVNEFTYPRRDFHLPYLFCQELILGLSFFLFCLTNGLVHVFYQSVLYANIHTTH